MHDSIMDVIQLAYAAAIDPSLWENWTEAVTKQLGGYGSVFYVIDTAAGKITHFDMHRFSDKGIGQYHAEMAAFDPQAKFVMALPASRVFLDTDHVDFNDPVTRDYLHWAKSNGNIEHHMTGAAVIGGGKIQAGISIHQKAGEGQASSTQQQTLRRLLPQFEHAFQLAFEHDAMLTESFWGGLNAQGGDKAMLLIDEKGHVIRMTEAAQGIVRSNDGLSLSGDKLRAMRAEDDGLVQAVIARAIGAAPLSGATRIRRVSGKSPYAMIVYPLVRSHRLFVPAEAAALATLFDPTKRQVLRMELYRQAFDLTLRESQMAEMLLSGHSVESAAAALRMALPTARIHIRNLLKKTDTVRQSDLLQLLSRLL